MADSYDDKIEAMLVTRQRMAEQRKAKRQKELVRQFTYMVAGLIVLIIVIAMIVKGCGGDKDNAKTPATETKPQVTTTANEEATTVPEETTEAQVDYSSLSGKTMYTTDILNLRTKASKKSDLIVHIPKGEKVKIISTDGEWCNVTYGDLTGYVKLEYLSETKKK